MNGDKSVSDSRHLCSRRWNWRHAWGEPCSSQVERESRPNGGASSRVDRAALYRWHWHWLPVLSPIFWVGFPTPTSGGDIDHSLSAPSPPFLRSPRRRERGSRSNTKKVSFEFRGSIHQHTKGYISLEKGRPKIKGRTNTWSNVSRDNKYRWKPV